MAEQLRSWTSILREAGVPSPEVDARQLAAHVLGVPASRVLLGPEPTSVQVDRIDAQVARRATREPLQHIVGTAPFLDLELQVGPGVFIPRPETEILADHAIGWLRRCEQPLVVELCAGSGAIAFAVACHCPGARIVAVERSAVALAYATRNLTQLRSRLAAVSSTVQFRRGDASDPAAVADLSGLVDAVLVNPPYVPDDCTPRDPEVRDFDPPEALYGGPDGMSVIGPLLDVAADLLRPGGLMAVEHGDEQGGPEGVPGLIGGHRTDRRHSFADVVDHPDLAGRPRFTTAQRGAGRS